MLRNAIFHICVSTLYFTRKHSFAWYIGAFFMYWLPFCHLYYIILIAFLFSFLYLAGFTFESFENGTRSFTTINRNHVRNEKRWIIWNVLWDCYGNTICGNSFPIEAVLLCFFSHRIYCMIVTKYISEQYLKISFVVEQSWGIPAWLDCTCDLFVASISW